MGVLVQFHVPGVLHDGFRGESRLEFGAQVSHRGRNVRREEVLARALRPWPDGPHPGRRTPHPHPPTQCHRALSRRNGLRQGESRVCSAFPSPPIELYLVRLAGSIQNQPPPLLIEFD